MSNQKEMGNVQAARQGGNQEAVVFYRSGEKHCRGEGVTTISDAADRSSSVRTQN